MVKDEDLLAALQLEKKGGSETGSFIPVSDKPWEIADRIDEEQIVAEMLGKEMMKEYVYSFTSRGVLEVGLTWSGVKAVVQRLREDKKVDLTIVDVQTIDTPDSYIVTVMCKDKISDTTMPGGAEQLKHDEGGSRDKHAYPKALTKAIRNSFRHFIPETMIRLMIKEYESKRLEKKMGVRK